MNNKTKLVIYTILSVLIASTVVMSISIPLLLNFVENTYIQVQLEANKNQSVILAKFLEVNLNEGTDEKMLLDKFQNAIVGSQSERGFVCIIDNNGNFINHPNKEVIGTNVKSMNINYKSNVYGIIDNWYEALQDNIPSGGIINFNNENSEIVYSVPLKGRNWKINSHENTKRINAEIKTLQNNLIFGATFITILIALFASYLVRKVSARYEKQIEDYNNQLQFNVKELNLANINLEKLDEEKNNILYVVAHDLKNPLAGILLNIEILSNYINKMTGEEVVNKLNGLAKTTNYMKDIVSKLLDKDSINNAKIKVKKEEFLPNEIIEEVIEQFKEQANKKNIKIKLINEIGNLVVQNDKQIFREIADNYLSNAIKYSPFDKNININLKIEEFRNNKFLIYSVKDEGPGISVEDQSHLFKKFNTLTARPTDGEDSTGIGLFGVKRNAQLIDAEVFCNSKLGDGAEFVLRLKV